MLQNGHPSLYPSSLIGSRDELDSAVRERDEPKHERTLTMPWRRVAEAAVKILQPKCRLD